MSVLAQPYAEVFILTYRSSFSWLGMRDIGCSLLRLLILTKVNFSRISLRCAEPSVVLLRKTVGSSPRPQVMKNARPKGLTIFMAGDEGFEPPITGPEPVALPLGQSPIAVLLYLKCAKECMPCVATVRCLVTIIFPWKISRPRLNSVTINRLPGFRPCEVPQALLTLGQSPSVGVNSENYTI